jgi:coenzyme F420-0:L-glutamate ligase/coenzyme F420-1:gamma-L-glutamate ligase
MSLEIIPIKISKDVEQHDNIIELLISSPSKPEIKNGDILVITQKIISKQEGNVVDLSTVMPSLLAIGIASAYGKDPRVVEVILSQSKRIVRMNNGVIITETVQGFICANAGIDESNVKNGYVTLLPKNADDTAKKLKDQIFQKTGKDVAVVISDTFGRPFREGQTNYAIGIAGISAISDYVGTKDTFGKTLHVTAIATVDEICSAAELVMGKTLNTPIAIVRNYKYHKSDSLAKDVIRLKSTDLFR